MVLNRKKKIQEDLEKKEEWAKSTSLPSDEYGDLGKPARGGKMTPALGHILEEAGLINEEMIDEIMKERAKTEAGTSLKSTLIQKGLVREEDIMDAIAEEMGLEKVELSKMPVTKDLLEIVPIKMAKQYKVFPVREDDDCVYVALSDPLNIEITDDLERLLQKRVVGMIASEAEIERMIAKYYEGNEILDTFNEVAKEVKTETGMYDDGYDEVDLDSDLDQEELPAVVKFVDLIFKQAVHERASDIHIEPAKTVTNIRFRVDGVLHECPSPPKRWERAILSRLKVLSRMDLAEKRVPQDGRIKLTMPDKKLDLRVSSLPAIYGESIVMRILDQDSVLLGLEDVGFTEYHVEIFTKLITSPTGIILMTGPTGSGKTTTLYAALGDLNTPEKKLITIEDPVEYMLEGVIQVQVNPSADVTFSTGLRAMLRQSPDVILVGEIRDRETAEIAIRAALTGHLVFSTLHTNDASTAPVRLIDMDVKPYLVASSMSAAIAQRLVRRICGHCKTEYTPSAEEITDIGHDPNEYVDTPFYMGKGCERCGQSGYRGRTAIHEIFIPDQELKQLILRAAPKTKLAAVAEKNGMKFLRDDGFAKVLRGDTTIPEVLRVAGADED